MGSTNVKTKVNKNNMKYIYTNKKKMLSVVKILFKKKTKVNCYIIKYLYNIKFVSTINNLFKIIKMKQKSVKNLLIFRMSMGSRDHLPSGESFSCLPLYMNQKIST